jgi:DNA polymerase-3 subunit beta
VEDIMEVTVHREEIYKAISKMQSIIEKRSNMPILSMILVTAAESDLLISATDLEISMQLKTSAEVKNPGSITIPGRKLFEILKESKSAKVYLKERQNNRIFISDENARYNLACLPSDEYPLFMEPEDVVMGEVDGDTLREMIDKTIYSVTMEEAGFKLSGVYMEKSERDERALLKMVSTDGHRLSLIEKDIEGVRHMDIGSGVMVPKKGMLELSKLSSEAGTVRLGFKQSSCIARAGDSLLVIRLLESKFPDYNAVVPKRSKGTVKVGREALLDGMKKMMILSTETYRGVKITIETNTIELVSVNPDLGDAQEKLEVEYKGERFEAGFNPRYFIDTLQAMNSEVVELGIVDNSSPCVIKGSEDKGFLGLIMPMRL